jgi:transglutaminase-like putative cysteine protease
MLLDIHHETRYRYDNPVRHSAQLLRLTPREDPGQHRISWTLTMPYQAAPQCDAYGNIQHLVALDRTHDEILIVASGRVETGLATFTHDTLPAALFLRATVLTAPDRALADFAGRYRKVVTQRGWLGLNELMNDLLAAMPYTPGSTGVETSAAAAFAQRSGVCQDHAHVFVAVCRLLGLPARYVSGFLLTDHEGHVASHAWAEVNLNGVWHGFDVSNGCRPDARYVRLAVGLDYLDACPIRGVRRGGGEESLQSQTWVKLADQQQ